MWLPSVFHQISIHMSVSVILARRVATSFVCTAAACNDVRMRQTAQKGDFSTLCVFKCLLKYSAKEIRKDRLCISKRWLFSTLHFQRHAMRLLHETDCAERRWAEFTPCPSQSPTVKEGLVIWPHCIHWSHKNTGRKKEPMHQAKKGPKADAAPLPFITFFLLPNVGTAWWRSVWSLVCHWSLIKVLISMSLIICQDDHDHHFYHQASENVHIFLFSLVAQNR